MKTKTTIYNAMGIFPGKKLKGKEKYQHLYHYTSFDTFVRIWCTQQLKLGSISGVNDIQEKDQTYHSKKFAANAASTCLS